MPFSTPRDVLDVHRLEERALFQSVGVEKPVDLVHLAAEPHHQDARMVRVACIAPHDALERLEPLAVACHAAAGAVDKGGDAVDIRIGREPLGREMIRDHPRGGGRAIHGSDDRDVVPRADLPALAAVAHEGAELVILIGVPELGVLRVDVIARRDVLRRVADDLSVFPDRRAPGHGYGRDLVPGRHEACRGHARDLGARLQGTERGDHGVGLVEANEGGFVCHVIGFRLWHSLVNPA